jgi:hypothetical protein
MQIHEITLVASPPVAEGVFDTLKAAATWEPGETFAQAKTKVKNDAGVAAVAKKAQAAWQSYEQQLQKSVAQQPATTVKPASTAKPTTTAKPAAGPATTQPGSGVAVKTAAGNVVKGSDGKWKSSTGEITNPADIQELERRAKKQATIAAQNKQMSPASGIREAVTATTSPGGIAIPANTKTDAPTSTTPPATPVQSISPLDTYRNRTDGKYEQALKGFVQQNLLAGLPYARLQNAQEIDQLINTMSRPENANPKMQAPLWQQLAQATAVAAIIPQSAGGAGPEPTANKQSNDTEKQTQSARELIEPVQQAMKQNQIDLANLSKSGQVLRSKFNNNETAIRSTGNPNVDAMLLAMGFTI